MNEAQNNKPEQDSGKLDIQNSGYINSVKKVPSQQDLIKKYKVKTVKQTDNSGLYISTYDKQGNLIATQYDNSDNKRYKYVFNKNGQIKTEKTLNKDGSSYLFKYEYGVEGKKISKTYMNSDGDTSVTMFEYNNESNTRKELSSTGTDKEFYDNWGLRVRFESYDEKGKLVGSGEAKYDKDGLKVSETSTIMGMNVNEVFEYNENGQLLKQHRTGILDVYFLFEYDAKGLMLSTNNIKGETEDKTMYEYTFY